MAMSNCTNMIQQKIASLTLMKHLMPELNISYSQGTYTDTSFLPKSHSLH